MAEKRRDIIEMITTILVYKFTNLGRQEIEQMLETSLQQTRFYQGAKEEGRAEGREEVRVYERRSLVSLQLNQKLGSLSEATIAQISTLTSEQLEALAIALLNFSAMSDLTTWLDNLV